MFIKEVFFLPTVLGDPFFNLLEQLKTTNLVAGFFFLC